MPCFIGCIALAAPRVALFILWFLGQLPNPSPSKRPMDCAGLFIPSAYNDHFCLCKQFGRRCRLGQSFGWLLVAIALLLDLGFIGSGHSSLSRSRKSKSND
ncbi:MAG: hypothetical protein IPJ88_12625 [Myxococcales bacterium]|nr:MAG: hypothetical protein IPJ88_12625 [Myxococcales bacterium]